MSECHPDKPNVSKGRCAACYLRDVRAADPERTRRISAREKARAYANNPDKHRRRSQAYRYGLTLAERDAMFQEAGGICEACGEPSEKTLHIDHCHTTGRIRGLLCHGCNTALGRVNDSPEKLRLLAEYLLRQQSA